MELNKPPSLESCPDLNPLDLMYIKRHLQVFRGKNFSRTIKHLLAIKKKRRWYVFGGTSDARYFTQLEKPAKADRLRPSIRLPQKSSVKGNSL